MMNVHQQSEQLIAFCHEWRVCSTRSALAMPCWLARHQRLHPNSLTTVRVVNVRALGATWLVDCFFSLFQSLLDFFFYSVVIVRSTFVESEVERSRNWCNLGRILNSPARNVEESSAGHPWNWFRFEDFPGLWNQIPTSGLVSTPHRFQRSRNNRANGLVPVCPDKFLWPLIWLVFTLMTVIRDRYTGSNRVKSIWSNLKR